jgi:ATP-dependent Clp protease ATP-binding subunit ClpC
MNSRPTVHDLAAPFASAVALDRWMPRSLILIIRRSALIIAVLLTCLVAVLLYAPTVLPELVSLRHIFAALCLIALAVWLECFLVWCYHNSYYFRGLPNLVLSTDNQQTITYDAAKLVLAAPDDLCASFIASDIGALVLRRSGVTSDAMQAYLDGERTPVLATSVYAERNQYTMIDLGVDLYTHDAGLQSLLQDAGSNHQTLVGALNWVVGNAHSKRYRARWWGHDQLSRVRPIGQDFSYGVAYRLNRYRRSITTSAVFSTVNSNSPFAQEKIEEMETVLIGQKASNILLVGEPGVGKIDLVMHLQARLSSGQTLGALLNTQVVVLDLGRVFTVAADKSAIEAELTALFDEAARAGRMIVVIEQISSHIRQAAAVGVQLSELLDPYLATPELHFIFTDTPGGFHSTLRPLGVFVRRCHELLIETTDNSATVRVLAGVADAEEGRYNSFVTYPALVALADAADRYIVDGALPDKAITLMLECLETHKRAGAGTLNRDRVYELVSEKTGIPAGPVSDHERDMLLHLEDTLATKVIGQASAVTAIAKTMRRSRVDISDHDRPLGSFLFLGPTGVGKTETSKVLAETFFGDIERMHRLDMSEFSGADGVSKLIGDDTNPGTLPQLLATQPYAVVLLDEFEKAAQSVHDIFLQILDEGRFTDGQGTKINARNTIIIATSNAGSQLILDTIDARRSFHELDEEIIAHIIERGIYRPELINRFSQVVIFEPLDQPAQQQVAALMLQDLVTRVKKSGYIVDIEPAVVPLLVARGYDPQFGARPLQRIIEEVIEEITAKAIIAGAPKGDVITVTANDVTNELGPAH